MKRAGFCAVLGVLLGVSAALGDTVYLKSGASLCGRIAEEDASGVRLLFEGGGSMHIDARLVASTARDDRTFSVKRAEAEPVEAAKPVPASAREETAPAAPAASPLTERERAIVEGIRTSTLFPVVDEALQRSIEANIYDMARWRTRNRVRAERKLIAIGANAVPWVIAMARHPFELTRRSALRILIAAGDTRAIPAALIGLADDDRFVRELSDDLLRRITGIDQGFRADQHPRLRARAAARWEAYFRDLLTRAEAAS
ncbi:MAG: hypothetical protein JXP34_16155 [Planctomycetes bacterium]|nr:hypothetical protein [Planctomycetota bacterium]